MSSREALVAAAAELVGLELGRATDEARARLERARGLDPDAGPEGWLGIAYEEGLERGARRASGSHFTPRALAQLVVRRTLEALGDGPAPRVLDPAMGAGAFLVASLRELVVRSGRPDTPALRRALATQALFGIDRDPEAVACARAALWLAVGDASLSPRAFDEQLVVGDALLEAPLGEVEGRFDAVVGNPPFLGGKRIRTVHGDAYAEALTRLHPGASKNTDLAAHFLRRFFDALRPGGALGFVVTNTIAQGDTREGGLAAVLRRGGTIVAAETRHPWPGAAGVVTSLLWLVRGPHAGPRRLDGREVPVIDALLSSVGRTEDPHRLPGMRGAGYVGCFLRGAGFVLDDRDPRAHPLAARERVLAARPESREVIHPFLGGEEVVSDPEQRPHRFVIRFGERSLDEARAFPEALALVEASVRPFREARRATKADDQHRAAWWRFANDRPELTRARRGLERVIVIPRVAAHLVAVLVPNDAVFSDQLVVVPSASYAVLALLSSRVHAAWARLLSSTLGDGLRYAPSDVLETFPAPGGSLEATARDAGLERAGRAFSEHRAEVLRRRRVGLTKLMARVHDPACEEADVVELRALWDAVDRATLAALGWGDLVLAVGRDERGRLALAEPLRAEVVRRLFARNAALASG